MATIDEEAYLLM
jgi:hypothetical protein